MSFEEGSVFPMAMATPLIALNVCLGIQKPTGSVIPQKSGLLIWGASSSVGTSALQLARNMGFKVFATASPAHHQSLKSLEALEVFDYHDSSVIDKIVVAAKSAGAPITLGFDAVGEGSSAKQAAEVLSLLAASQGNWRWSCPGQRGNSLRALRSRKLVLTRPLRNMRNSGNGSLTIIWKSVWQMVVLFQLRSLKLFREGSMLLKAHWIN